MDISIREKFELCKIAAENGYIEVLQNCLPISTCRHCLQMEGIYSTSKIPEIAVQHGHLDCLKYALEHGCDYSHTISYIAAREGRLYTLMYLHEKGYLLDEKTIRYAELGGHLDCLSYLYQNGSLKR